MFVMRQIYSRTGEMQILRFCSSFLGFVSFRKWKFVLLSVLKNNGNDYILNVSFFQPSFLRLKPFVLVVLLLLRPPPSRPTRRSKRRRLLKLRLRKPLDSRRETRKSDPPNPFLSSTVQNFSQDQRRIFLQRRRPERPVRTLTDLLHTDSKDSL